MNRNHRRSVDIEALNEASRQEVRGRFAAKRAAKQAELARQADIRRRREATIELDARAIQDMRNVLEEMGVVNAQTASAKKVVGAISAEFGLENFLRQRGHIRP